MCAGWSCGTEAALAGQFLSVSEVACTDVRGRLHKPSATAVECCCPTTMMYIGSSFDLRRRAPYRPHNYSSSGPGRFRHCVPSFVASRPRELIRQECSLGGCDARAPRRPPAGVPLSDRATGRQTTGGAEQRPSPQRSYRTFFRQDGLLWWRPRSEEKKPLGSRRGTRSHDAAPCRGPAACRASQAADHQPTDRGWRVQLLRRSRVRGRVRDPKRPASLWPRPTDHREVLRPRRRHHIHHERCQPSNEWRLHLSVPDHGRCLGCLHRSGHKPTVPRRHGDRQRRLDRWERHDHARSTHRSRRDRLDRIGGYQRRAGLQHRRRNPATHIKDRFTQDEVRVLVRLAWWNWPIAVITENIGTISAGPVKHLEQIAQTLPR